MGLSLYETSDPFAPHVMGRFALLRFISLSADLDRSK